MVTMSSTAVFAILAVAMSAAVFAWVLRPILREKPLAAAGIAAGLLGASLLVYRLVGTPQALDTANLSAPQKIEDAIAMLERKMTETPEREGLALLANAYAKLDRWEAARDAWQRSLAMATPEAPTQPSDLAAAAEARMRASGDRRFDARAVEHLQRALALDPKHQRARFFMGLALRQQGKPKEAAAMWEPLLDQLDQANTATLRKEVDAARIEAGLPPLPEISEPAPNAPGIRVSVVLDPEFAARVRLRGDTSVFVIARAVGGPPMPVAVEKHAVSALPLRILLDDSDSPMPTAKLSSLKEVELVARLSESGDAMRQDGDLESKPVRVALPTTTAISLILGER
jgi:cytochrome c-type biogenesis protein CcmH